jgi:hypothetical protein
MTAVLEHDGLVIESGAGLVIDNCADCPADDTMPFAFTFVGVSASPFVTGSLTRVDGLTWRYNSAELNVCPSSSGSQALSVVEIVLYCDGGVPKMSWAIRIAGSVQAFQTEGGSLDPLIVTNSESPRTYYTRTPGDEGGESCDAGQGYYRCDIRVKA